MAGSGVHKRSKTQRELDLAITADWYLKGKLQQEIAEHLASIRDYTLTQQQISADLKAIRKRWQASAIRDFDELKAQELAKVDHLELTYWDSWERSKVSSPKDVHKVIQDFTIGDPRFLTGVQWCINKRCEILGIDAPAKFAPTDPTGRKPYQLTESERMEKLTALLGEAMAHYQGAEEEPEVALTTDKG